MLYKNMYSDVKPLYNLTLLFALLSFVKPNM